MSKNLIHQQRPTCRKCTLSFKNSSYRAVLILFCSLCTQLKRGWFCKIELETSERTQESGTCWKRRTLWEVRSATFPGTFSSPSVSLPITWSWFKSNLGDWPFHLLLLDDLFLNLGLPFADCAEKAGVQIEQKADVGRKRIWQLQRVLQTHLARGRAFQRPLQGLLRLLFSCKLL